MSPEPAAIVEHRPETEADFRRWVRDEFKHLREMQQKTHAALDLILQTLKAGEETTDG